MIELLYKIHYYKYELFSSQFSKEEKVYYQALRENFGKQILLLNLDTSLMIKQKILINIFIFLGAFILCFTFTQKDKYLFSIGDVPVFYNKFDIITGENKDKISLLRKGEYVKVNKMIDIKHYLGYEVMFNERKAYVIYGDYIITNEPYKISKALIEN